MPESTFLYFDQDWKREARPEGWDWYQFVPKERAANLAYRQQMLEDVANDPDLAEELWTACKRDILFWLNTFVYLKEPRNAGKKERVIPWITWPCQDFFLTEAEKSFGVENFICPKTRAAGASWQVLALFLHRWLFFDDVDLGLASKNEEKVDSPDDPSCLFAKLDFMLEYLPPFLKPRNGFRRGPKRLVNNDNNSTFIGYPSTGSLNRGGRNTAFFQDEPGDYPQGLDQPALESVRFVTDSQFIVGTFVDRAASAWNRIALDAAWPAKRVFLRWIDCPPMRAGLYTTDDKGEIKRLDPAYKYPDNYPFKATPNKPGALRSPYFDEKSAGLSESAIARELNADLEGATQGGFDREKVRLLQKEYAQEPVCRGRIVYDRETYEPEFIPDPVGPWLFWIKPRLGEHGKYVMSGEDEYCLGVDVSAGTGASDSSIQGFSRTTGEHVAEFADPSIDPKELARLSKAAGTFFGDDESPAYLVPEVNGLVGRQYLDEIKRIGYFNIHRRVAKQDEFSSKPTKKLGWWTPPEGPGAVLQALIELMGRKERIVRSKRVYDQLCQYVWKDGKIVHPSERGGDESEARASHGDCAVAAALGSFGVGQRPRHAPTAKPKAPAYGSGEWLENYLRAEEAAAEEENIFTF